MLTARLKRQFLKVGVRIGGSRYSCFKPLLDHPRKVEITIKKKRRNPDPFLRVRAC